MHTLLRASLALALAALTTLTAHAATYHVAANGNDTNDGLTPSTPWRTLAKVNSSTFSPGDQILLRRGDLWREQITVSSTSVETNPIVYGAYGTGQRPRISGAEIRTGWTLHATNVYKIPYSVRPWTVTINDQRVDDLKEWFGDTKTVADLVPNHHVWEAGYLYIMHTPGNPDTLGHVVEVGLRDHGITGTSKRGITVRDLQIEKTESSNIRFSSCPYPTVENCVLLNGNSKTADGAGVMVSGSTNMIVRGCVIRDAHGDGILGFGARNALIEDNFITTIYRGKNLGGDCIQISASSANANDGFVIQRNIVTQEGTNTPKGCIQQEFGDNGVIRDNVATYGAFGIAVNGSNVLVERNVCGYQGFPSGEPFSAAYIVGERASFDNVTYRYNVAYATKFQAFNFVAQNGPAGTPPYNRTNFRLYNNTIVSAKDGVKSSTPISGEFRNNLVWAPAGTPVIIQSLVSGGSWTSNRNLIGPNEDPTKAVIAYLGTNYTSLAAFTAATGQDANSSSAYPELADPYANDLRLWSLSPAVGAGQGLGVSGLTDVEGNPVPASGAVNLGAYNTALSGGKSTVIAIKDNADASGVVFTGTWSTSSSATPYFATNYRHDGNSGKGAKTARFTPNLARADTYRVFMRWNGSPADRPDNVPVTVTHSGGTSAVVVNMKQNTGPWFEIGQWAFAAGTAGDVLIANTGTSGFVIADAVRWESVQAAPPPTGGGGPVEVVVDNTDAGFAVTGSWSSSTTKPDYYGTNYRFATTSSPGSKTATWTPDLPEAGTYEVYYWLPDGDNARATNAPFTVTYNGGSQAYTVNQQGAGGAWVYLGSHPFAAGTAGKVTLTNAAGSTYVIADAIKFVKP